MKLPNDLSSKGVAVEEWIDLHFYRRIGIKIARALQPTDISADQVTLWAILIGVVAGHLFVYRDPWVNAIGFLLFVVSDIFDSSDGQLARLRGKSTRMGRALDGMGDNIRFVNLYIHLLIRLSLAGWHWHGLLLVALAGLSHSIQSMSVDFIRNAFLLLGEGKGSELDLPEDLPAEPKGFFRRIAASIYAAYVRTQTQLFPRTLELIRALRRSAVRPSFRAEYRERQQPLLPICSWLGQNIRFALLGLTAVAGHPQAFLWTEGLAMNIVLVLLLSLHEANAATLSSSLEREASAY